jgi:hypothetical protein
MTEGKRGIRLQFSVCAGRRLISAEAIQSFLKETSEASGGTEDPKVLTHNARAQLAKELLTRHYGYSS